eukprot:gene9642-7555_t
MHRVDVLSRQLLAGAGSHAYDDHDRRPLLASRAEYDNLWNWSISDPCGFWGDQASQFHWHKRWQEHHHVQSNLDTSKGPVSIEYFRGGQTNISFNCLDRWVLAGCGARPCLIWEGNEVDQRRTLSYRETLEEVCRMANWLKAQGVQRGDTVTLYLPMTPELPISMLACARIGAVHSVVFAGFSADSLAQRIMDASADSLAQRIMDARCEHGVAYGVVFAGFSADSLAQRIMDASVMFAGFSADSVAQRIMDARSRIVVTSSGMARGSNKIIPLKKIVDDSLQLCTNSSFHVHKVLVLEDPSTPRNKTGMQPGRDVWWVDELASQPYNCEPEWVESEAPLFLLYTSGSTGMPKGVVHTTGGYMVAAATMMKYIFDVRAGDVFFATADCGWITGHTAVTYGPLLLGASSIVFGAVPVQPTPARSVEIVERYQALAFEWLPPSTKVLGDVDAISARAFYMAHHPIQKNVSTSIVSVPSCSHVLVDGRALSATRLLPGSHPHTEGALTISVSCSIMFRRLEMVERYHSTPFYMAPTLIQKGALSTVCLFNMFQECWERYSAIQADAPFSNGLPPSPRGAGIWYSAIRHSPSTGSHSSYRSALTSIVSVPTFSGAGRLCERYQASAFYMAPDPHTSALSSSVSVSNMFRAREMVDAAIRHSPSPWRHPHTEVLYSSGLFQHVQRFSGSSGVCSNMFSVLGMFWEMESVYQAPPSTWLPPSYRRCSDHSVSVPTFSGAGSWRAVEVYAIMARSFYMAPHPHTEGALTSTVVCSIMFSSAGDGAGDGRSAIRAPPSSTNGSHPHTKVLDMVAAAIVARFYNLAPPSYRKGALSTLCLFQLFRRCSSSMFCSNMFIVLEMVERYRHAPFYMASPTPYRRALSISVSGSNMCSRFWEKCGALEQQFSVPTCSCAWEMVERYQSRAFYLAPHPHTEGALERSVSVPMFAVPEGFLEMVEKALIRHAPSTWLPTPYKVSYRSVSVPTCSSAWDYGALSAIVLYHIFQFWEMVERYQARASYMASHPKQKKVLEQQWSGSNMFRCGYGRALSGTRFYTLPLRQKVLGDGRALSGTRPFYWLPPSYKKVLGDVERYQAPPPYMLPPSYQKVSDQQFSEPVCLVRNMFRCWEMVERYQSRPAFYMAPTLIQTVSASSVSVPTMFSCFEM